ncbi:MAG: hypothetical protein IPN22_11040 [Bacteroidetes bacterium]|nr:hypothetical protein [Bacteroidota bacterium]
MPDSITPIRFFTTRPTINTGKKYGNKNERHSSCGLSYGAEYTDSASIHAKGYDVNDGSHGTHVAGIAGGSGYGGDSTHAEYRGMAYSSDLVL